MLKIVCFLWGDKYSVRHVNTLHRMVARHLSLPHEFICITDSTDEFEPGIKKLPLWDKCRNLGGCFNRLYVFSEDMRDFIGERFVCIDLDCVITGDITPLFNRHDDFIINSYQPLPRGRSASHQLYNGGMFMMRAGARKQVWDTFDPSTSPSRVLNRRDIVGTDQAWIRECLGVNERRWGIKDGVYEARNVTRLPADARIVFFAGNRDPSTSKASWISDHYK